MAGNRKRQEETGDDHNRNRGAAEALGAPGEGHGFIQDKPGSMLAMEMGTGKTRIAIDHMERLEARRTLVLAPLSVVDHVWPGEIRRHGRRQATIIPWGTGSPTSGPS